MRSARMARMASVAALVLAGSLVGVGSAAGRGGGDTERVDLRDDCDPVTFNAVLGDGACVGDGDTTVDELFASLVERGFHGAWRNNPSFTTVDSGTGLRIVNRGGEFHTLTEVAQFGPGCVPELNAVLGLDGPPAMDCADPQTFIEGLPAGSSRTTEPLAPGTHFFQCAIHPWMHTTVVVEGEHEAHDHVAEHHH